MSGRRTLATARRVLAQLRHDHRTVALMLVVPCVLVGLLAWIFDGTPVFDQIGGPLLGVFPFVVMFVVTSVATLRERTSGTLERLLSMPLAKLDLLLGYALAFGAVAVVQALLVSGLSLTWFGLDVAGPRWLLVVVAVVDAVLGMALGLFVSAFAATEFQAVQFMPALVFPQMLLCGLFVERDKMAPLLEAVSNVLPLTYAFEALERVTTDGSLGSRGAVDVVVTVGVTLLALALGAATLRRRTP